MRKKREERRKRRKKREKKRREREERKMTRFPPDAVVKYANITLVDVFVLELVGDCFF